MCHAICTKIYWKLLVDRRISISGPYRVRKIGYCRIQFGYIWIRDVYVLRIYDEQIAKANKSTRDASAETERNGDTTKITQLYILIVNEMKCRPTTTC